MTNIGRTRRSTGSSPQKPLTVPTLLVDSLWDQEDIYGAPAVFNAVKASPNAHLVLGPWHHGQANSIGRCARPARLGLRHRQWFRQNVMIPFLDEHLKGGPPANIARVTAFEAGTNQWKRLDDWPLACARACPANLTPLYLAPGDRLSFSAPAGAGLRLLRLRPGPARSPTAPRPNLPPYAPGSTWRTWLVDDQRFAEARPDVLTYSTAPLDPAAAPRRHAARPPRRLDQRHRQRLGRQADRRLPRPISAKARDGRLPARDRHGRHPRPLPHRPGAPARRCPPNQPVTYEFALPSVDYVVQPGHRLMVQVQSSWFPLYDRNPQTFVPNIFFAKPRDYRAATQRVFTGREGTWIGLPVVK